MISNCIDEKDNQIINLLRENGRMSFTEIGTKLGLSRTAVKNRITALEKSGIIKGYTAIIDPIVPSEMEIFISTIETEPAAYDAVAELLKGEKCVATLCKITGDNTLHAVCVAKNDKEMRDFMSRILKTRIGAKRFSASRVRYVIK